MTFKSLALGIEDGRIIFAGASRAFRVGRSKHWSRQAEVDMLEALKDQLPKALLGALIPLAQFLWRQFQQRKTVSRKDSLRKNVIDLSKQLAEFKTLADTPSLETARRDIETELAAVSAALAALTAPITAHQASEPRRDRSLIARTFLLYAPHGAWAWIVHMLFFMNTFFLFAGTLAVLTSLSDPEVVYMVFGFSVFLLPEIGLNALARMIDERNRPPADVPGNIDMPGAAPKARPPSTSPASGAQGAKRGAAARAFLLFIPQSMTGWVFHALFYLSVLVLAFGIVSLFTAESRDDVAAGLLGMYVLFFAALLWRALALRSQQRNENEFVPVERTASSRRRWIAVALFWWALLMLPLGAAAPYMDEPDGFSWENIQAFWVWSVVIALYFVVLAVSSRGWMNAIDARAVAAAPRLTGVRAALLLFRPSESVGWLAIAGFWIAIGYFVAYISFVIRTWQVQDSDAIWMTLLMVALCGAAAIAAREWAVRYRPAARPEGRALARV